MEGLIACFLETQCFFVGSVSRRLSPPFAFSSLIFFCLSATQYDQIWEANRDARADKKTDMSFALALDVWR